MNLNFDTLKFKIFLVILIQLQGCDLLFGPSCGDSDLDRLKTVEVINIKNYQISHIEIYNTNYWENTQPIIKEVLTDSISQIKLFLSGYTEFGKAYKEIKVMNDTLHLWYSPYSEKKRQSNSIPCIFRKMACDPVLEEIKMDSLFIYKPIISNITVTVKNQNYSVSECSKEKPNFKKPIKI